MGSIKVGKLADFTVLYRNPLDVADPDGLRDIKVPGTVMCGKTFPAGPSAATKQALPIKHRRHHGRFTQRPAVF